MKIQNLSIIFLVIIIPLIMILSYYLNLQRETLELQAEYDTKLAEATKEGVKAFEINTVDWAEWVSEKMRTTERSDVKAAINTFITSLANNLNIAGTAKEFMVNYIPAVAVTMYDGYYVYAPNYVPVTILNDNNEQLYYNEELDRITTSDGNGSNLPIYKPKDGVSTQRATYRYIDDENNYKEKDYTFVTDIDDAKMEYKHILSSQIAYVEEYSKEADTNVVVNYTLDNRIYVYGTIDGESVDKDGYLVYFERDTILPRIKVAANAKNNSDITVLNGVDNAVYSNGDVNTQIEGEILEEQVLYYENNNYHLKTFKYIYDIEQNKLYYDEVKKDFFEILDGKYRAFIDENSDIERMYKSVSVLVGNGATTKYKKIYQALNGKNKGQWYINIKDDSDEAKNQGKEEIDTKLGTENLDDLGLSTSTDTLQICKNYSAISYYTEAYAFTNWVRDNLGNISITVEGTPEFIFNITSINNPEKETAPIVVHKKEIMKDHIITNLNLAISNYSNGSYDFKLPVLSERDWNQIFSNISMVTFFQGMPMGLKYYNNYAIATSTNNREYVDPDEIYFSGDEKNYHKAYCEKCGSSVYTGYRSVEYTLREYKISDTDTQYYYQHDNINSGDEASEIACYYCLVNRANYKAMEKTDTRYAMQTKSYNEALARERYYQKEQLMYALFDNVVVSVIKKEITITNTDIIFILDDSGSMSSDYTSVKQACSSILNAMIGEGLSENFYIGFIRFDDEASKIGSMTNKNEAQQMINSINVQYGSGGGTDYVVAFNEAIRMIDNELHGRGNKRVIVFMTDGTGTYDSSQVRTLKEEKGVDSFYAIAYSGGSSYLNEMVNIFAPNSKLLSANDSNLTETFKNILYQLKSEDPVETIVDEQLDISDITLSENKPLIITVSKNGVNIKTITITQRPTSSEGVVILQDGKVYLSLEGLANECGLEDFEGINVSIEYFAN